MSWMKLTKRFEIVSSFIKSVVFELGLNGFEVQRWIGSILLNSATMVKESFDDWWILEMVRLRNGWDVVEEHMMFKEFEFVSHSEIGGRFWIQQNTSGKLKAIGLIGRNYFN